MFWKKGADKPDLKTSKLPGPKSIEELIGRALVLQMKQDPDWVWALKSVLRPNPERGKKACDFRVFAPAAAAEKKANVRDYTTLDEHPDLVLYEGWFDRDSMRVEIEKQSPRAK